MLCGGIHCALLFYINTGVAWLTGFSDISCLSLSLPPFPALITFQLDFLSSSVGSDTNRVVLALFQIVADSCYMSVQSLQEDIIQTTGISCANIQQKCNSVSMFALSLLSYDIWLLALRICWQWDDLQNVLLETAYLLIPHWNFGTS